MTDDISKQDLLDLAIALEIEGRPHPQHRQPALLAGVWKHLEHGLTYTVSGICHVQNSSGDRALDCTTMVRYFRDNTHYVRPVADFRKKFVPVPGGAGASPHKLSGGCDVF